ncbi:aspartate kinase [Arthrobacter ginkgonis]|uniref:Aspartokinase n=1 Tax=Arthrobacter ginkgonis TaxID=1630594 RepID=A0ABP7CB62_9MICC
MHHRTARGEACPDLPRSLRPSVSHTTPKPEAASGVVVQKFGGSSVATPEAVLRVARRIMDTRAAGYQVVVVVSAMGDTTDDLLDLAIQVAPNPSSRELDLLLTAGERISVALLGLALAGMGAVPRPFAGAETGLITDEVHGKAHVLDVDTRRVRSALGRGEIPIVAGFQGRSHRTREITTLGRGGSDITAIALAAALQASVCEIYTDVDGVYTADPRVVPSARKINSISSEGMLELAASGAKVLHVRCVEYARRFGVTLHVRSSFSQLPGTFVVPDPQRDAAPEQQATLEEPIIAGITTDRSEARVTISGIPNLPGAAALLFGAAERTQARLDMVVEGADRRQGGTELSFTVPASSGQAVLDALFRERGQIGFGTIGYDDGIGKICLNGFGIRRDPELFYRFCKALADAGVEPELVSVSEFRICVVVRAEVLDAAAAAVHRAFGREAVAAFTAPDLDLVAGQLA